MTTTTDLPQASFGLSIVLNGGRSRLRAPQIGIAAIPALAVFRLGSMVVEKLRQAAWTFQERRAPVGHRDHGPCWHDAPAGHGITTPIGIPQNSHWLERRLTADHLQEKGVHYD